MLLKTVATRNCFLPILVALVLLLSPTFIFPENPQDQELQKKEEKSDPYSGWLNDVVYIITSEEGSVFKELGTDEEKESFIEQFWRRRDPDPSTGFNDFKMEHYRRIAYANEHYTNAGIRGWKSDRGRIYITYGPPQSVSTYAAGATYVRKMEEGLGKTKVFPTEQWYYDHIEGVGAGIEVEFVDRTMTGEFRLALRPEEKDALLMVGGARTFGEIMGVESRLGRIQSMDAMRSLGGEHNSYHKAGVNSFMRLERYFDLQRPPQIKFNDLKKAVTVDIRYDELPFSAANSYLRLSQGSLLVPITVFVPREELAYKPLGDQTLRASVNLYGSIKDLGGRTVQEFEETIYDDRPQNSSRSAVGARRYQKIVRLQPAIYKLDLVAKDLNSNKIGHVQQRLDLPLRMSSDLSLSSLVLSDLIIKSPDTTLLPTPFATPLGWKVYPASNSGFRAGQRLGLYFEVYNFDLDGSTSLPDLEIVPKIRGLKAKQGIDLPMQHMLSVLGDRVAVALVFTLEDVEPGKYTLELEINDRIQTRKVTGKTRFTVAPKKEA